MARSDAPGTAAYRGGSDPAHWGSAPLTIRGKSHVAGVATEGTDVVGHPGQRSDPVLDGEVSAGLGVVTEAECAEPVVE